MRGWDRVRPEPKGCGEFTRLFGDFIARHGRREAASGDPTGREILLPIRGACSGEHNLHDTKYLKTKEINEELAFQ